MSDGFGLFYRRWKGVGRAQHAVICMHGIETHSEVFRFLGGELAAGGVEVYAFDRRGFGNSIEEGLKRGDASNFKRHLEDMGEFVAFVRENHAEKRLVLLGHSLGCAYCLWYAANNNDIPDGVVLAAPPIIPGPKVPILDQITFPFFLLFAPKHRYNYLAHWPREFRQSEEYRLIADDPLCTREFSVRWLVNADRTLAGKMLQNASRINKPVFILQGEKDLISLPAGAKKLLSALSSEDKELSTFPDADHWFYHALIAHPTNQYNSQQRREVSKEIQNWLTPS